MQNFEEHQRASKMAVMWMDTAWQAITNLGGGALSSFAAAGARGAPDATGTADGRTGGASKVSGAAGPGAVKATDTRPSTSCSLTCTSSAQNGQRY